MGIHIYIHCFYFHRMLFVGVGHVNFENPWFSVFLFFAHMYICMPIYALSTFACHRWLAKVDGAYMGKHIYIQCFYCHRMLYVGVGHVNFENPWFSVFLIFCPYVYMYAQICSIYFCLPQVASKSRWSIYGHTYIHALFLLQQNAICWG